MDAFRMSLSLLWVVLEVSAGDAAPYALLPVWASVAERHVKAVMSSSGILQVCFP